MLLRVMVLLIFHSPLPIHKDMKYKRFTAGFTLIELIVVMSVTALLSTLGIASFLTYSRSQDLQQSANVLTTYLQTARSEVLAQVKPAGICSGPLQSYQVLICCKGGGSNCPTCYSSDNLEMDVDCGSNSPSVVLSYSFPSDVAVDDTNTTKRSFVFVPITGGINGISSSAKVTLKNTVTSVSKVVTVSSAGVIQ